MLYLRFCSADVWDALRFTLYACFSTSDFSRKTRPGDCTPQAGDAHTQHTAHSTQHTARKLICGHRYLLIEIKYKRKHKKVIFTILSACIITTCCRRKLLETYQETKSVPTVKTLLWYLLFDAIQICALETRQLVTT